MIQTLSALLTTLWLLTTAAPLPAAPTRGPEGLAQVAVDESKVKPAPVTARETEAKPAPIAVPQAEAKPSPAPLAKPPGEGCLARSIDAIQARYEGARDIAARFTQTSRAAHLAGKNAEATVSKGHMVVAKPGKMRWTYESPEPSLVVSDGESLWLYDPAFGEAQKLPVTQGFLSGAAIEFLLGEGDMRRDFDIALESCDAEAVTLQLTPKTPASYEKLQIVADPRTGDLSQTRIDDLIGNSATVVFEDLRLNQGPDAATFRFDVPEGVDVIEIEAP